MALGAVLLVTGFTSTLAWAWAAVRASGYGLDISDEGFYLLSYRFWDTSTRNFTGSQYLYGPLLELLGQDIAQLRVLRLVMLLLAHGYFAWAFLRWLRQHPGVPRGLTGWGAGSTIVASAGLGYGWLPQSPGYNDVSVLVAVLLGGVACRTVAQWEQARQDLPSRARGALFLRLEWLLAGVVVLVGMLSKWTAAGCTAALTLAVLAWAARRHSGNVLVPLTWALGGGVAFVVAFQALVMPWSAVLGPMVDVTRYISADSNSPTSLLLAYARTTGLLLSLALPSVLIAGLVPLLALRGRPSPFVMTVLAAVTPALALAFTRVLVGQPVAGGAIHVTTYAIAVSAVLLAGMALTVGRPRRHRRALDPGTAVDPGDATRRETSVAPILLLLALLPLAQGFGTGNAVLVIALDGMAPWTAALVLAAARASTPRRAGGVAALAVLNVTVAWVAASALLLYPYNTEPYAEATTRLSVTQSLGDLRLDPATARQYDSLVTALRPYTESPRRVLAVDEMAGIVLVLGQEPLGEAWNSVIDHPRTAAGVRAACEEDPAQPAPIVLADGSPTTQEVEALRSCGIEFYPGYREIDVPGGPEDVTVFIPRTSR